jgi:MFS family permease
MNGSSARKSSVGIVRVEGYSIAFWLALAANALFYFSFQATFPVLPRFIADVVMQRPPSQVGSQVGLATTVLALVAVFTRIPAGRLTDRLGRHRFLLVGAACFVIAPVIYAISRGLPVLLLGRAVHGVGLAVFSTAFQALVTELAPEDRRGAGLGLAGASTSVAFMTAPVFGDWLAINATYAALFEVCAAAALLSALLVAGLMAISRRSSLPQGFAGLKARPPDKKKLAMPEDLSAAGLKQALKQSGVRSGVLTMAALGIPFGAFITFLPLFADERQITGVGVVYSIYAGTILLAQPLSGWLADRIGRLRVILPGLFLTGLATGVLSIDGSLLIFALSGIIFGIGGGLVRGGADPLVQDSVPPDLRGTAAAVQYTSFDFWIGMGSYPLGMLATSLGYALTFAVTGLLCAAGGSLLGATLRRQPAP